MKEKTINKYESVFIFRETEVTGCEMEDGSDTRETKTKLVLVPQKELEQYHEACADDYGSQDYSYTFDSKQVAIFFGDELKELKQLINEIKVKGDDN
jgi:hypothetical protein